MASVYPSVNDEARGNTAIFANRNFSKLSPRKCLLAAHKSIRPKPGGMRTARGCAHRAASAPPRRPGEAGPCPLGTRPRPRATRRVAPTRCLLLSHRDTENTGDVCAPGPTALRHAAACPYLLPTRRPHPPLVPPSPRRGRGEMARVRRVSGPYSPSPFTN